MKILFIQASGLGNSILLSPTIKRLNEYHPKSIIDLYVYREVFAAPYREAKCINQIHVQDGLKTISSLRNKNYDVSLCGFPSNRWQFHLLNRIVGSCRRISHDYPVGYWRTLRFLETDLVPTKKDIHDVEQNLQLLNPLGIPKTQPSNLLFPLNSAQITRSSNYLEKRNIQDCHLIGIHTGSGPLTWKRAPLDEFLRLLRDRAQDNSHVLIFGGPEEDLLKKQTQNRVKNETELKSTRIDMDIYGTAALISDCNLFISNDSGLSHVAAAVNVPSQITIFNGTNPTRTRPWRDDAEILQLRKNVMKYPFETTRPVKR